MLTLPDYLEDGLDLVFVGINPGKTSAEAGHYFANKRNRFWPAFNAAGMTPVPLGPETDAEVLAHGIGFTDVVKRATRQMSELKTADFRDGVALLNEKLLRFQPGMVCFNGLSGYKQFVRFTEPGTRPPKIGLQPRTVGASRIYVLPSTSPANAAVSLERIVDGLRELKVLLGRG
jgi:TDG/mug DNA glycosylase family protein